MNAITVNRRRVQVTGKMLHLLATPVFAAMALYTATSDGSAPMICSAAQGGWALGGMSAMYLLMAAFHLPAWLERWRRGARKRIRGDDQFAGVSHFSRQMPSTRP